MSYILLTLALLSGILGTFDKLTDPDRSRRRLGWVIVLFLAMTLSLEGYQSWNQQRHVESVSDFLEHEDREIDEASGGTAFGDHLYVVDDDKHELYRFPISKDDARTFSRATFETFKLKAGPRSTENGVGEKVVKDADDLEGAATDGKSLFLVTSHSPPDDRQQAKPERHLFLRIDEIPAPGRPAEQGERRDVEVAAAVNLDGAIRAALEKLEADGYVCRDGDAKVDWNIEGFAIDGEGRAYFGLRNPIAERSHESYALILTGVAARLFSAQPELSVVPLVLKGGDGDAPYGITSLDMDGKTLVILGNSSRKLTFSSPRIWRWEPGGGQQPVPVGNWTLSLPSEFHAKPEVLILPQLPGCRLGYLFIDSEGHGGRRVYEREAIGALPAVVPAGTPR
jgi:hypothetical protein